MAEKEQTMDELMTEFVETNSYMNADGQPFEEMAEAEEEEEEDA